MSESKKLRKTKRRRAEKTISVNQCNRPYVDECFFRGSFPYYTIPRNTEQIIERILRYPAQRHPWFFVGCSFAQKYL